VVRQNRFKITSAKTMGVSGRCIQLTTQLHLVPKLRMSGAILLFSRPHIAFIQFTGTFPFLLPRTRK